MLTCVLNVEVKVDKTMEKQKKGERHGSSQYSTWHLQTADGLLWPRYIMHAVATHMKPIKPGFDLAFDESHFILLNYLKINGGKRFRTMASFPFCYVISHSHEMTIQSGFDLTYWI